MAMPSINAERLTKYDLHLPKMKRAFTITELLVASAIALMVMGAVAQLFSLFGRSLSQSQATVELASRLRTAAWQLRQDLAGVTVELVPWAEPESDAGYFELIEGPQTDTTLAGTFVSGTFRPSGNPEADTDDVLLFTTRSRTGSFTGRYDAETIEAPCAEVAWFLRPADTQSVPGMTTYNLYRRQLLVVGYVGKEPFLSGGNSIAGTLPNFAYDISLRRDGGRIVPNTLGDLTKRENRFMRSGTTAFPHSFQLSADATFDNTTRVWEDVLLTNVVGFDARVYDPRAQAQTTVGPAPTPISPALLPGDPGYAPASAAGSFGAYVDLGWGGSAPAAIGTAFPPTGQTAFQSGGLQVARNRTIISPTNSALTVEAYDTWSLHYEFNGIDDDGVLGTDQGTNGTDDNGDGVPDNPPEYETSPPYPVPLTGLEVRIRCLEPTSRQVRQITIRHTFQRR